MSKATPAKKMNTNGVHLLEAMTNLVKSDQWRRENRMPMSVAPTLKGEVRNGI